MSLGWELSSTHNCPISHRRGNCNCTCVDRGGRCRQRALAIYTQPGFFLFNLFSSPLPLLAPIFLSTALRSCSTTCELENRKILFWWSSGLTKAGKFLIWLITVLTVETPVGSWGGWRALNLWDFCFSYLSKVLNIGFRLHRRSDKSEWCVFQSRKVQALRIKEIPFLQVSVLTSSYL